MRDVTAMFAAWCRPCRRHRTASPPRLAKIGNEEGDLKAYQLFFFAAQGLHGLAAFAAQGLHGLALAAQGLHGLAAFAAQGLHGLALAAQGLHGLAAFAAQGLHGFLFDLASAVPRGIANAATSAKTATNDTIRLMSESPCVKVFRCAAHHG
jgi:hypothetical protein